MTEDANPGPPRSEQTRWHRLSRASVALAMMTVCMVVALAARVARSMASSTWLRCAIERAFERTPTCPLRLLPMACAPIDLGGPRQLSVVRPSGCPMDHSGGYAVPPPLRLSLWSDGRFIGTSSQRAGSGCAPVVPARRAALRLLALAHTQPEARQDRDVYCAWAVTWTNADGRARAVHLPASAGVPEVIDAFFEAVAPPAYPENGGIHYDVSSGRCGACTSTASSTTLSRDGHFETVYGRQMEYSRFAAKCRFVPGDALRFTAWMTAHGMGAVADWRSNDRGPRTVGALSPHRLWQDLVAGPCLASWGYTSDFADPVQ